MAKAYADERRSMGKVIAQHEMIADYLDEMRTDVQAHARARRRRRLPRGDVAKLELIGKFTEIGDRRGGRARQARARDAHARWRAASRRSSSTSAPRRPSRSRDATCRSTAASATRKDYGAEKLLRDALVMPIYEGTSQIQSLMAMKDTLFGIIKNPQAFVTRMGQARWRSVSSRDPLERRVAQAADAVVLGAAAPHHAHGGDKLKTLTDVPVAEWRERSSRTGTPSATSPARCCTPSGSRASWSTRRWPSCSSSRRRRTPSAATSLERWLERAELALEGPLRRDHDDRRPHPRRRSASRTSDARASARAAE